MIAADFERECWCDTLLRVAMGANPPLVIRGVSVLATPARSVFFYFFNLVRGLNFRTRATSAAVHILTVIPPTSIGFGPSTFPATSQAWSV